MAFRSFGDYVALCYHEGRNVRHLIKERLIDDATRYERIRSLPNNKYKAWAVLGDLRQQAHEAPSASRAARAFQNRFELSLADLEELFENPGWKHSAYGGNAWAGICTSVIALGRLIDDGAPDCEEHARRIAVMRHNTGSIGEKLVLLDAGTPESDE